ncbi:hypothetical protein ACMATS_08715 [Streptoverticillium reticulum]|uniref:hypothetical protein n=1 Tax=Streptoverticillium reticulum TaxID=1433415 RepID=UPI0039BFC778
MRTVRQTRCLALLGPRRRAAHRSLALRGPGPRPHPSRGDLPTGPAPEYPGREHFGPGRANIWILLLRLKLITTGWAPEQRKSLEQYAGWEAARQWDDALRAACTRFQLGQGRRGDRADGYPDAETWRTLWAS